MASELEPVSGLTGGSVYGRGFYRPLVMPTPAAGQPVKLTLEGSETIRFVVVSATLVTSAAVANRQPYLQINDQDAVQYFRVSHSASVVAGSSVLCQWLIGQGSAYQAADGDLSAPLPTLFVQGGYSLAINAVNLQAGDQITPLRCWVESYPIGPYGYQVTPWRLEYGDQ